jgi:hypothetical protein
MIDNGGSFGGADWQWVEGQGHGYYFSSAVYANVRSLRDFDEWIARIDRLPESVVVERMKSVPDSWISSIDERHYLERHMEQLLRRRGRVGDFLLRAKTLEPKRIPSWHDEAHRV